MIIAIIASYQTRPPATIDDPTLHVEAPEWR
jgi:hypothetical protein